MTKYTNIGVRIETELYDEFKKTAKRNNKTIADSVREALKLYTFYDIFTDVKDLNSDETDLQDKTFTMKISTQHDDMLTELSKKQGISKAKFVRDAIEYACVIDYLKEHEEKDYKKIIKNLKS